VRRDVSEDQNVVPEDVFNITTFFTWLKYNHVVDMVKNVIDNVVDNVVSFTWLT
jgi:hypothetical protein